MQTLYLDFCKISKERSRINRLFNGPFPIRALQEWFYPLKNAEVVSGFMNNRSDDNYIQPVDRSGDFTVSLKLVDPNFFRIYPFNFFQRKLFTTFDLESGICTAVITEELARRLFDTAEGVVGRSFSLDYVNYRVCGVVRSASYLTSDSYAQVYIPYSVIP